MLDAAVVLVIRSSTVGNAQHLLRLYQTDDPMKHVFMKGDACGLCLRKVQRFHRNKCLAPDRNRTNDNVVIRGSAGL